MLPQKFLNYINEPSFDSHLRDRIKEWGNFQSFTEFIIQNEKKINKRLKTAKEIEDKRDIGIELYIGFIFSDTNCQVIYEPNISIPCNPDFQIHFQNQSFFCEVKRIRKWVTGEVSNEEMYKKCGDIICEKIIQTVPNSINLIYIRSSGFGPWVVDFENAVRNIFDWIKKDPESFLKKIKKNSISSIEEFHVYWKQLSGIIIPKPENNFSPHIWKNQDASMKINSKIESKIEEAIRKPFRYDLFFDE